MVPELSVVVPMFNEEQALPLLVARLRPVLDRIGCTYEVLAVDDGSEDLTPALLQKEHRSWPQLRVVRLRANAGHQAAMSAGLVRRPGDYVVSIDADLQDPPETIAAMLELAREPAARRRLRRALRPLHRHACSSAPAPGCSTD